jgi:hypothetical protein
MTRAMLKSFEYAQISAANGGFFGVTVTPKLRNFDLAGFGLTIYNK